jgi:hypothetical protein
MVCTVTDINVGNSGLEEIGVEFIAPNAGYWRVSFPPADWNSRCPEAKRYACAPPAAAPSAVPSRAIQRPIKQRR